MTIKEYRNQIVKLCKRLSICPGWGDESKEQKIIEVFYNGLSKRCQLEMARLNIRDCNDIYSLINSTEETHIEQMKSMQPNRTKHGNQTKNSRYSKGENKSETTKYCTHHKLHIHDTSECKALKRKHDPVNQLNNHHKPLKRSQ
ncbi:hypothetical protein EQH57_0330 [Dictyocoela roeselum]|nr:hypothetical protein EQH57_0330 [Dictyocoela roeselum]